MLALLSIIAQVAATPSINVAELFQSHPYTSAGGARTITNGVDLATHGGFIWERVRSHADEYHSFMDTKRGLTQYILPESPAAEGSDPGYMASFNIDGYSLQNSAPSGYLTSSHTYRIAPRFLDILTWTGTGSLRELAHNLGVEPGMIWAKQRNGGSPWQVYHRSIGPSATLRLDSSNAQVALAGTWTGTLPDTEKIYISNTTEINAEGSTYFAYVFAHDPAGVIQCGGYTGNGSASGPTVNLGWRPQLLLIKRADGTGNWNVVDAARAFDTGDDEIVTLNTLTAASIIPVATPTATGFIVSSTDAAFNANGGAYVYMAIRSET